MPAGGAIWDRAAQASPAGTSARQRASVSASILPGITRETVIELARTPRKRQELQVNRLKKFKQQNAGGGIPGGQLPFPVAVEAAGS